MRTGDSDTDGDTDRDTDGDADRDRDGDADRAALRIRPTRIGLLAVVLLAFCVLPLATATPWLLFALVLPLIALAWVLRVGVDIGPAGVTVRALLGHRFIPWSDVAGLRSSNRGDLSLVLTTGRRLRLPTLRARHLSLIAAASGGHVPDPKAAPAAPGPASEPVGGGQ